MKFFQYKSKHVVVLLTDTLDERIAERARSANASRLMSSSLANSCLSAAVLVASWSADSVEALAYFVVSAVLVILASALRTSNSGVTLRTRWTRALSSMSYRDALGASTANNVVD